MLYISGLFTLFTISKSGAGQFVCEATDEPLNSGAAESLIKMLKIMQNFFEFEPASAAYRPLRVAQLA